MSLRDAYRQKLEAQLEEQRARLEVLNAQAKRAVTRYGLSSVVLAKLSLDARALSRGQVFRMMVSADGKILAAAGGTQGHIWDAHSGKPLTPPLLYERFKMSPPK